MYHRKSHGLKVTDYKINSGAFKKIWEVSGFFDKIEVNLIREQQQQ